MLAAECGFPSAICSLRRLRHATVAGACRFWLTFDCAVGRREWRAGLSFRKRKERRVLNKDWFARPVLFGADIERTLGFYVNELGFAQSWRYDEGGKALVAQAERQGCALIFSAQWPDKVGKGLMFISLDMDTTREEVDVAVAAALDRLRAEFEGKGVSVQDGFWGYRVLIVRDPDGNELYFSYPDTDGTDVP